MRLEHWIKAGLVDAVSSDAHNCTSRPTLMRQAYERLCTRVGQTTAQKLTGLDGWVQTVSDTHLNMCPITKGPKHGPAPIPEEGAGVKAYEIKDISGYTHGVGWCAPQQGDVYKRQGFLCKKTCESKDKVLN